MGPSVRGEPVEHLGRLLDRLLDEQTGQNNGTQEGTAQERISIGNVEVLAVVDIYAAPLATSTFFPDVPEEAWEPYRKEQLSPTGEIVGPFCHFAIRSQGRIIMADTPSRRS